MFTFRKKAVPACEPCTVSNDNQCPCPPDEAPHAKPKPKSLKSIFRKCAMCAGSGAGGLLVGHAGCIITPAVMVAAGATTMTAGLPLLALAFSAAATAGGLYAWHRLRGHTAGKWEKRVVIGSALAGVLVSSAFHLGGHHHEHHDMPMPDAVICGAPRSTDVNNRNTGQTEPVKSDTITYPVKNLPPPPAGHGMHH